MNEEIKKQLEEILHIDWAFKNSHSKPDKVVIEAYPKACNYYLTYDEFIENLIKIVENNYLQGAKDMREAVKEEELVVADFDGTNSTDISMRVGYNMALRHTKRKAQQFIDSLEKETNNE